MLDGVAELNQLAAESLGDPEINTRIAQYEMAFRMQSSVPELTNLAGESKATLELYGPEVTTPGTFAHSAIMARRLAERGVRMIQLYHRAWDHHGDIEPGMKDGAQAVEKARLIDPARHGADAQNPEDRRARARLRLISSSSVVRQLCGDGTAISGDAGFGIRR